MNISRRDFLKWMLASGAAVGFGKLELEKVTYAMESMAQVPVVWLQAAGCSGCTISFLNMLDTNKEIDKYNNISIPTINKFLAGENIAGEQSISLKYDNTLMAASGLDAIKSLDNLNNYVLIVEGSIPTAEDGMYCVIGEKDDKPLTALQALEDLAPKASYIMAVGTCASFKGVTGVYGSYAPTENKNPIQPKSVQEILGDRFNEKIINLPGCPVHPYIIGETIIRLLLGEKPYALDGKNRPYMWTKDGKLETKTGPGPYTQTYLHVNEPYYTETTSTKKCPLKDTTKTNVLGKQENCFYYLGCKGRDPETKTNCYTRYWGTDTLKKKGCMGAGHMCIGCTSANFPFKKIYT